jgi:hypothetical protein
VGAIARASVDLWLVVALMAMAFGAGVIVKTMAEPPAAPATSVGLNGGTVLAPPLTDQQLGQGLPAGHPSLSDGSGSGNGGGGNGGGNGGGSGGGGNGG